MLRLVDADAPRQFDATPPRLRHACLIYAAMFTREDAAALLHMAELYDIIADYYASALELRRENTLTPLSIFASDAPC